jgi:hypothetical protein
MPYLLHGNRMSGEMLLTHCADVACESAATTFRVSNFDWHRPAIAVANDGRPVMVNMTSASPTGGDYSVIFSRCADNACSVAATSILETFPENSGFFSEAASPAVAIGSDGLPLVVYNDRAEWYTGDPPVHHEDPALYAVHCLDQGCEDFTTSRLDDGFVDSATIDVGADGLPVIAYRSSHGLRVEHCDDVACTSASIVTVDARDSVRRPYMALDPFGMPVIVYYDATGHDLVVARLAE